MILPKKRERPRSGIARAPQREWPRHRKFIRSLECCIPHCMLNTEPRPGDFIECAHVRTGTDGGTGIKPSDWWAVPLCSIHHLEQHTIGEPAFEQRYVIDMKRIALALARQSPDVEMRKAMREAGV